jgi:hypothetical protein
MKVCKIHTDLNVSDPLVKPLPQAKFDQHWLSIGVRIFFVIRALLTLVQVEDCWNYTLEAIIKDVLLIIPYSLLLVYIFML